MTTTPPTTILIIDDTPDNIGVLFETLQDAGHRVLVAESGESALESVKLSPPDLILLDVMMPGMDGFTTCRALKARNELEGVPIIFMSALNESVDKVRGLELGAVDYVTKPVFPEEVRARVHTHLQLRALQHDLAQRNQQLEDRNEALDQAIQQRVLADAALQRALDRAVLVVDGANRISFIARPAQRLLIKYFPDHSPDQLPPPLNALRTQTKIAHKQAGLTLIAQRAEPPREDGVIMIALEEKTAPAHPDQLQSLGLTPREAEILFWIAQGKTSPEIGIILGLAKATVKKHVESILPKLGVETRLAAALRAHEVIQAAQSFH